VALCYGEYLNSVLDGTVFYLSRKIEGMNNKSKGKNIIKGGYTPSVMGTLLVSGPMLIGASIIQGKKLIENEKSRLRSRSRAYNRKRTKRNTRRKMRSGVKA
jgi:hypothetical protein